jgi:hypothetical protein
MQLPQGQARSKLFQWQAIMGRLTVSFANRSQDDMLGLKAIEVGGCELVLQKVQLLRAKSSRAW